MDSAMVVFIRCVGVVSFERFTGVFRDCERHDREAI